MFNRFSPAFTKGGAKGGFSFWRKPLVPFGFVEIRCDPTFRAEDRERALNPLPVFPPCQLAARALLCREWSGKNLQNPRAVSYRKTLDFHVSLGLGVLCPQGSSSSPSSVQILGIQKDLDIFVTVFPAKSLGWIWFHCCISDEQILLCSGEN